MCILVVLFKNRIDNHLVRAGYTCGLSISQRLPCSQPSELLLGWQSYYILLNIVLEARLVGKVLDSKGLRVHHRE